MKDIWLSRIILFQSIYYIVTGLWALFHYESFTAVVGPKPDIFQLNVTASLVVMIGVVLLLGFKKFDKSLLYLSFFSCLTFIGLVLIYIQQLRIIFLGDTFVESVIALIIFIRARKTMFNL